MFGVNPSEVYISTAPGGGYAYHTTQECPNLPTVYKTLQPDDPEYEDVISRDECQWCRYDTLNLELPDGD